MYGSHLLFSIMPIWAIGLLLYVVTMMPIFVLRDQCEGLYYNTSYSAVVGDAALIIVALIAATILQNGIEGVELPKWLSSWGYHFAAFCTGITLGIVWYDLDHPKQLADRYHHLVIAPLLCYLGMTLVPVIVISGTMIEMTAGLALVLVWIIAVIFDANYGRLDQRKYLGLGSHLDRIKAHKWAKTVR